jgi:hypothetical protein
MEFCNQYFFPAACDVVVWIMKNNFFIIFFLYVLLFEPKFVILPQATFLEMVDVQAFGYYDNSGHYFITYFR